MGPAVILDTETTDRDEGREVIEAAWLRPEGVLDLAGPSAGIPQPLAEHIAERFVQRYKPARALSLGAMAVHHILPSELEGCPPPSEFSLPEGVEYIVGHNIDFDWEAIGRPNVKRICTYAMAGWVWQDADSYSQSALLYLLRGQNEFTRELLRSAHSALADVENNALLLQEILEAKPEITTWAQLYEFSEACRIPRLMPIGEKQGVKGLTLDEAVDADPGFVDWCLRQSFIDDYLKTGLRKAIQRAGAAA